MDQLPHLDGLSEPEKDALIQVLWAEIQALKARIAELEAKLQEPKKDAHNSSVPPSKTPKQRFLVSRQRLLMASDFASRKCSRILRTEGVALGWS